MHKLSSFGAVAGAVLVVVAAVPSCKTATTIRAHYTTDFGCVDGYLERKVMFSVSRTNEPIVFDGRDPSDADSCIPGPPATVGDAQGLVIRPNESADPPYDGTYEVVAIVGTDGSTEASCNLGPDGKPKGDLGGAKCVVARRKVRFVSGIEVEQKILLSSRCAGVPCAAGSTCNPATRLCAQLSENAGESGGDPTIAETDAGAPPLDGSPDSAPPLDATAPLDATVAELPLCGAISNGSCGGGPVSLGPPSMVVPKVVAGFDRAAWIDPGTRAIHQAIYPSIGTAAVTTLPSDPLLDPKHLAYGDVAGQGPRLAGAFVNAGGGNDSGDVVRLWNGTAWSTVGTPFGGTISALVSNGAFLAGWVAATTATVVPFEINGLATAAIHAPSAADPTIAPFMGSTGVGMETRFVWAHATNVSFFAPAGKLNTVANALPTRSQSSRLVTYGPNQHLVAITTASDLVYFDDGIAAGTPFAVPLLAGVVDAAADAEHIYAVRPHAVTMATEVVVITKAALPVVQACRVATALNIKAITVDNSCVYLTTAADRATGSNLVLSLLRVAKPR